MRNFNPPHVILKQREYSNAHILGAASFTIYSRTKEYFINHNILCKNSIVDVGLTGGISGAMSGALISFGSARESITPHHSTYTLVAEGEPLSRDERR